MCLDELLSERHCSARAAVEASLRRFGTEFRRDHALARSLLSVVFSSPIVRAQDQADVAAFYPALVQKLERAQTAGDLSDQADASEIAGHLMAVVTGALTAWALEPRPSPRRLRTLLDRRLTLAFGGLEP